MKDLEQADLVGLVINTRSDRFYITGISLPSLRGSAAESYADPLGIRPSPSILQF